MKYTVRFFTRDIVNGEMDDEHMISMYQSNKYIPVPRIGEIVCLEDAQPGVYKVVGIEYAYPSTDDEEYEYDIVVILEVE